MRVWDLKEEDGRDGEETRGILAFFNGLEEAATVPYSYGDLD